MERLFMITQRLAAPLLRISQYRQHIASIAAKIAELAGTAPDPQAHGRHVAERLLPDMLRYELGTPAQYGVASTNGRALTDDVFDVTLSLVPNTPIADRVEVAWLMDMPRARTRQSAFATLGVTKAGQFSWAG